MKRVIPVLVTVSPYLFVLRIVLFFAFEDGLTPSLLIALLSIIIAVYLMSLIYCVVRVRAGESARWLLFWTMLMKLCCIPFYTAMFVLGSLFTLASVWGLGMIAMIIFIDYLFLIPTTMFTVAGLSRAKRMGLVGRAGAFWCGFLSFFFCFDVAVAIIMYLRVRKADNDKSIFSGQ